MADMPTRVYGKGGMESCHQSDLGGHRGLEGTLNKFLSVISQTEATVMEWQL